MALNRAPDDTLAASVVANRIRFTIGLVLVTIGAGAFAVAFRGSLTAFYHKFYGADYVVDSIAGLPRWLRLMVPVAAAALAGSVARLWSSRTQGVSNVIEAFALGRLQLPLRATASRVASSWVAIAGGLSIGREGQLIEVGAALGAAVGRAVETALTQTRVLIGGGPWVSCLGRKRQRGRRAGGIASLYDDRPHRQKACLAARKGQPCLDPVPPCRSGQRARPSARSRHVWERPSAIHSW